MAPFRPAASCVLSAEGVDDRKSIELWLSLHTNDFIPLSNVCVRTALDYQSNLWPNSTLRAITVLKEAMLVKRLSPLICLFTSYQVFFFTFPLVIINILGNSICSKPADNPESEKYNLIILLQQTHLQAQQDLGAENNGWALTALWMLLDHCLNDR